MDFLVNGIQAVANFLWGTPMTIARWASVST